LGVDVVICGIVYKFYKNIRENAKAVADAPAFDLTRELGRTIRDLPQSSVPYAVVRGSSQALRLPINSQHAIGITGVVQQLVLKEHKTKWSWRTRWWSDTEREIQNLTNSVPFVLRGLHGGCDVEVVDALKADILDLHTIHDQYQPVQQSVTEVILGFFLGEHSKGFQQIESMLVEGTVITGIGELVWKHGGLQLQAPSIAGSGKFYLTQMSQQSLVSKLESDGRVLKIFIGLFGALGVFILMMIGRRWYKEYKEEQQRAEERRHHEELRAERRRQERERRGAQGVDRAPSNSERSGELQCVVCLTNPREVLIQNCRHVVCCADCINELRPRLCPICRVPFTDVTFVYIS